jgi:hypothetical protein
MNTANSHIKMPILCTVTTNLLKHNSTFSGTFRNISALHDYTAIASHRMLRKIKAKYYESIPL